MTDDQPPLPPLLSRMRPLLTERPQETLHPSHVFVNRLPHQGHVRREQVPIEHRELSRPPRHQRVVAIYTNLHRPRIDREVDAALLPQQPRRLQASPVGRYPTLVTADRGPILLQPGCQFLHLPVPCFSKPAVQIFSQAGVVLALSVPDKDELHRYGTPNKDTCKVRSIR